MGRYIQVLKLHDAPFWPICMAKLLTACPYGVSAGKRDQIEIFFKKKFLSKIDVDLIIWSRTFIISKKIILSIWSLFPALTPYYPAFVNIFFVLSRSHSFFLRFCKPFLRKII